MTRQPGGEPSPREAGLRRLATGRHDRVLTTLQQALHELHKPPHNRKDSAALRALVDGVPSAMRSSTGSAERAKALWRLIMSELERIGSPEERVALRAALHLDPTNREPSIDSRLKFARERGDFSPHRSGRSPGYDALRRWWGDGVRRLGERIDERIGFLQDEPHRWREYLPEAVEPTFRRPSRGAQPVFVECFVTTVFMRGRFVHRRITERLITAQEDGVAFYTARALPENTDETVSVPVRAIWGCRAERLPSSPGKPILTRLHFPVALQRGQRHYFSSEAMAGDLATSERLAINVEIDHHGIAPGKRLHDTVPVSGLTIRVKFDEDDVPEACWWYAEVTERERYERPGPGDDHWLAISPQGMVEHTFSEPCQPLANYGVAFSWPDR
jgi:hypothetical protein